MSRVVLATLAAILGALLPVAAAAEQAAPNYDKLKSVLEKKFAPAPATRSLSPEPETAAPKEQNFEWIKQKATIAPAPPDEGKSPDPGAKPADNKKPDKSGSSWLGRIFALLADKAHAEPAAASDATASDVQPPARAEVAQAEVPIAKRNSYVIQLKPDATEEQIGALLQKYDLTVTKIIGQLGVITVESNAEAEATRGLAPAAPSDSPAVVEGPGEAKERLQSILEPPLIKKLRQEPIVDAAIVNSTIGTKLIPHPGGATIKSGDNTYAWSWGPPGDARDGNWGLKSLRMPPVWTVLEKFRKSRPDEARPKIGIIDTGFIENGGVRFLSMRDVQKVTVLHPDCGTNHAMHVAGIIGASQGAAPGVDGMIPDARIDAIAISDKSNREAGNLGVENLWELQTLVFDEVLEKTINYIVDNLETPDNLRVINISLGYNFLARNIIGGGNLDEVGGLKLHIHHQASIIRTMANRVQNRILFVVSAGNDSEGRETPLEAYWASPFAWAGTYRSNEDEPARNILVVEAIDRGGKRADFSNAGGQVAAPGVDIMSTLATGASAYAVCSGTSQAAPHAAALAAILFELDPSRKPADIVDILKSSGRPSDAPSGGAPAIDALAAVLDVLPSSVKFLADLNGDGVVDGKDLAIYRDDAAAIEKAATTAAPFTRDLNHDGVIDDNECFWPGIDFNGSGSSDRAMSDFRRVAGRYRSDLSVMGLAWSGEAGEFATALADAGLDQPSADTVVVAATDTTSPPAQCRRTSVIAAPGGATTDVPRPAPPSGSETGSTSPSGTEVAVVVDPKPGPGATAPGPGGATPPTPPATPPTPAPGVAENTPDPALRGSPEEVRADVQRAIEQLKKDNPGLRVVINPATGLPSSVTGLTPQADPSISGAARSGGEPTEEDTRRAVEGYFSTRGLGSAFPMRNKSARTEYVGRRKDPDFPDRYIATVEQRVGDIPVFGSTAKLTVQGLAGVTKYVGTPSVVAIADTVPKVAEEAAIAAARTKLDEIVKGTRDVKPLPLAPNLANATAAAKLVIYDPAIIDRKSRGATRLAWLVSIESFRLFVDAKTGEVFHYYRDQPSGMLRRIFDLGRSTTFPGSKVLDEEGGVVADELTPDAETAFRNAGVVRDYFFMVFGRDSYDDNDGSGPKGGGPLESFVRYGSLSNAFWCQSQSYECPKPNVMIYGPGYANAIDIVAHEMTHGVIAHEKNLLYLDEPGAVNESLADIFGTLVELYAATPRGNWVIGETLPGYSTAYPMRSLSDPNLRDRDGKSMFNRSERYSMANRGQPDNYEELLTRDDPLCARTRLQDNGCVHFNSGILNKFAYLISEGGEQRGVTVAPLGRTKLARLAYRTMTAQLNQNSGLVEAAEGFMLSCLELAEAGKGGFSASDCQSVTAAQQAVGLNFGS